MRYVKFERDILVPECTCGATNWAIETAQADAPDQGWVFVCSHCGRRTVVTVTVTQPDA